MNNNFKTEQRFFFTHCGIEQAGKIIEQTTQACCTSLVLLVQGKHTKRKMVSLQANSEVRSFL